MANAENTNKNAPSQGQLDSIDAVGANDATQLDTANNEAPTNLIDDVCVLTSADGIAAPLVIAKPVAGDTPEIALQPGQKYFLDFQEDDVASMTQEGDALTITFKNGESIILTNFTDATSGDSPAVLSFQDELNRNEFSDLITVVETVPSEDELEEPQAELREDEDTSGEEVAQVEPAAGEPTVQQAQEVAQIEPAAGDEGGGETDSSGNFESSFVAGPIDPITDVGPIDPTLLNYGVEFRQDEIFIDEDEPQGPVNGNPIMASPDAVRLDETDFDTPGGDTVGGILDIDFGSDGRGDICANGEYEFSGSLLGGDLTSGGVDVIITPSETGYVGTAGGDVVFTFEIDRETGEWTYKQDKPFDHADGTNPNDEIELKFGVKATDSDGDRVDTEITVIVADDAPIDVDPAEGTVDEDDIGTVAATISGQLDIDLGEDTPGTVEPNGPAVPDLSSSILNGTLTSNGVPVDITPTANGYVGTAGGNPVFTLTINNDGSYNFVLEGTLDHADPDDANDVITIEFPVLVTDFDGDSVETTITINILDSGPTIVNPQSPTLGNGYEVIDETDDIGPTGIQSGTLPIGTTGDDPVTLQTTGLQNGTGTGITSGGVPVTIIETTDGYVGQLPDGTEVFTLDIDPNTGDYDFELKGEIDHPDSTNPDDVITIDFGVEAVDGDGDTAGGIIRIDIKDDGPSVVDPAEGTVDEDAIGTDGAVIKGQIDFDFGEDDTQTIKNRIDQDDLDAVTTNWGATVEPGSPGDFNGDGEISQADLDYVLANWGEVVETGGANISPNGDPVASGSLLNDALTSGGVPVVITQTDNGYVGKAGDDDVFEITINNDGSYEFVLKGALDHADPNDPNDAITFDFPVIITDFDGDSVETTITINVLDSVPEIPGGDEPAIGEGYGIVDETDLDGGFPTQSGTVPFDLGKDTPGTLETTGDVDVSGSVAGGKLTSNGVDVIISETADGYVGKAGDEDIFTLTINPDTGEYEFVLTGVVDHADGTNPDDVITIDFGIEAKDADGDTAGGVIRIDIKDDAPTANDDFVSFDQDDKSASGNVIDNDDLSNDDVDGTNDVLDNVVTQIKFGTETKDVPEGGTTMINGDFGVLEIGSNGEYTYTLFDGAFGETTNTLNPQPSDVDGFQDAFTKDGITVKSANGADLTWVPEDGSGLGIAGQGSDKVFRDETLEVSFDAANEVALTIADIGQNNLDDFINLVVQLEDGSTQNYTFDIGQNPPVDNKVVITLDTVDFGGKLITGVDIASTGSFLLNDVEVTHPGEDCGEDKFEYTLTDNDGDSDTAVLHVSCDGDDEPIIIKTEPLNVDETDKNPTDTDSGAIIADFFADAPGTFSGNGDVTGDTLTSNGIAVDVNYDAANKTYTGTANGEDVFTFEINPTTGEYEFTLIGVLDHPIAGPPGAAHNDTLVINFGVTATDSDNDSVDGTVAVTVFDDGPSISSKAGRIDETALRNSDSISVTRTIDYDFGEDGPGTIEPTGNFSGKHVFGGPDVQITSGGVNVEVTPTANGYIGIAAGVTIFTLTINPANGTHTYTQFEALDHPDTTNTDEAIWLKFEVQIVDNDGDTDTAYIIVDVEDDAPVAEDDTNSTDGVTEIMDNVLDNDEVGVDEPGVVKEVTFGTQTETVNGPTTIVGDHGTLVIDVDGSYTYTPNGTEGSDVFTYVMGDADGDMDSATLTIGTDIDSKPVIGDVTRRVDETNLDPTESVSGTVPNDFGLDGAGEITGASDGFSSSGSKLGGNLTSNGQPVNVVYSAATNAYTGTADGATVFTLSINAQTGAYEFVLEGVLDHADANDPNDVIDLEFGVQIKDSDDDTDTGTITIKVRDDAPVANDDTKDFDLTDVQTGGDVTVNDDFSNDTPNLVTEVSFGTKTVDIPTDGSNTIDGDFGELTLYSNGEYEYVLFDELVTSVEQKFDPATLDFNGFQSSVEFDGITISSNNGQDLTYVPESDPSREGSGIGIADRNDVVFGNDEALIVGFENPIDTAKFTFGDIGANDLTDGLDFKITLSDGRVVDFEFDIGSTTVVDGLIDVTLNASDYGDDVSINEVEVFSVSNSDLGRTSFVLNCVHAERSVDLDPTQDVFQYTLTDGDGDSDLATLSINGLVDAIAANDVQIAINDFVANDSDVVITNNQVINTQSDGIEFFASPEDIEIQTNHAAAV